MKTKKVEITLTATASLQYVEVVEVPADITADELRCLVNDRYTTVGGDEFSLVPGSWDRGDCGALDAPGGAVASAKAIRVPGGLLTQAVEGPSSEVDYPMVTYLTNALGELHTGDAPEALLNEVPFEDGPGFVLAYLVEINGALHVLGNLEVAYESSVWDGLTFPPEPVVAASCRNAVDVMREGAGEGVIVFPLDHEEMPDRCVISVAIPVAVGDKHDDIKARLAKAFKGYDDIQSLFTFGV